MEYGLKNSFYDTFRNFSGNPLSIFTNFIPLDRIHIQIKILLSIHMYLEQLFKNILFIATSTYHAVSPMSILRPVLHYAFGLHLLTKT